MGERENGNAGIMTLGKVLTLTRDAAQHRGVCVTDKVSAARRGPERHMRTYIRIFQYHSHFKILLSDFLCDLAGLTQSDDVVIVTSVFRPRLRKVIAQRSSTRHMIRGITLL